MSAKNHTTLAGNRRTGLERLFMDSTPWLDDACSLVDAFRAGERNPVDELEACLAAIDASELNAFCHLDTDAARARAADADVQLPFGGVPVAVKELEPVAGWPYTEASLVFADRVADHDSTQIERLRAGGRQPLRSDDRVGVRRAQRERHEAARHHPQPVGQDPHDRRIIGRLGRRGCRRASSRSRPAATAAARSASPPASTACSA